MQLRRLHESLEESSATLYLQTMGTNIPGSHIPLVPLFEISAVEMAIYLLSGFCWCSPPGSSPNPTVTTGLNG